MRLEYWAAVLIFLGTGIITFSLFALKPASRSHKVIGAIGGIIDISGLILLTYASLHRS